MIFKYRATKSLFSHLILTLPSIREAGQAQGLGPVSSFSLDLQLLFFKLLDAFNKNNVVNSCNVWHGKSSIISHAESMNTMFSRKGGNALTNEGKQGDETEGEMEKRRGTGEGEREGGRSAEWC